MAWEHALLGERFRIYGDHTLLASREGALRTGTPVGDAGPERISG